ncbi:MAG: lipoyl synthase [Candidatus Altiarchaeota archaeon]
MDGRKPPWLKVRLGGSGEYPHVHSSIKRHGLHTVCEEARCPNMGECWGCGTATFLIMGELCTRNCRFCAVKTGASGSPLDGREPAELAACVKELGIRYAVITSVDRDDLPDKGAGHFAECIKALKSTGARVEALIPDYAGKSISTVVAAGPDVLAHNIEVVKRLQGLRDARASYEKSLETLRLAKTEGSRLKTKSSIMLGLGETDSEVLEAMDGLRSVGCDHLTIGQYLQPTRRQVPVAEYVSPEKFREYADAASGRGFSRVVSEPLARTSYKAGEK